MNRETGFYLFHGNRLESLVEILAENLQFSPPTPLEPETILVQSKGMQKWLSLKLAEKLGIWANCNFPFPNALINRFFSSLSGKQAVDARFERGVMSLNLFSLFPELLQESIFSPLKGYLNDDASSLKGYQLAHRLANLFDQYSTYRPELLLEWEEGREEGWQAELWRRLVSEEKGFHQAALKKEFLLQMRQGSLDERLIPGRINVFAVSTLPPFHLDMLSAAAEFSVVNFYLLNPCREYWFDFLPAKREARLQARTKKDGESLFEAFHYESGHPFLSSWGKTGSEFLGALFEKETVQDKAFFVFPDGKNLLHLLQADILSCQSPSASEKIPVCKADNSLQVHSCHTPLREMEILQDYLLSCFDSIPDLKASDVLVMTPDIEEYAPYITAVFDSSEDESRRIPFAIADRNSRDANRLARFLFELFALRKSRFEASRVVGLLECPHILRRFSLQGPELEQICHWLHETRIRWGIDADDRQNMGLPPVHQNSWQAGLERLLLGYALPGNGKKLFQDILPYQDIEGNSAAVLGRFLEFQKSLASTIHFMSGKHPFRRWVDWLHQVLSDFFHVDNDSEHDLWAIEKALQKLAGDIEMAAFEGPIEFDVVEAALKEQLSCDVDMPGQFLSGKVTFCALLPMRSIPFRVIALVGLNDGKFPRRSTPMSFDLMARYPRKGDRSSRDEDKYLFLETLISARDRIFISYLGQDMRDNSEIQPSVVVSELLAYLATHYRMVDGAMAISSHIHLRHPLQSFDSRYFSKEGPLFSYSRENLLALQAASRRNPDKIPAKSSLPLPHEEWQNIGLSQLLSFFHHPVRYFFRQRLGIFLEERDSIPEDRENFQLQGLERFQLGNYLTESFLDHETPEEVYPTVRGGGILPHGIGGRIAFEKMSREANALAVHIMDAVAAEKEKILEMEESLGDYRLSGKVAGIFGDTLVRYRFASVKGRERLKIWLEMLFLQAFLGDAAPARGLLVGTDGAWTCQGHPDPCGTLHGILNIYTQGLAAPIAFFPETSLKYWQGLQQKSAAPEAALEAARKTWEGSDYRRGESDDPYYNLCFSGTDPLTRDDFAALAERVYRPMLVDGKEA